MDGFSYLGWQVCSRYGVCSRGEVSLAVCYLALLQFQESSAICMYGPGFKGEGCRFRKPLGA